MKAPSGTFVLKLLILAVSATTSIVLVAACKKSSIIPNQDRPVFVLFLPPGTKTIDDEKKVRDAFQALGLPNYHVAYYDKNQVKKWEEGNLHLTMTGAMRSEASENQASVDPVNVLQKANFASLDEAQKLLSAIAPTPTPAP